MTIPITFGTGEAGGDSRCRFCLGYRPNPLLLGWVVVLTNVSSPSESVWKMLTWDGLRGVSGVLGSMVVNSGISISKGFSTSHSSRPNSPMRSIIFRILRECGDSIPVMSSLIMGIGEMFTRVSGKFEMIDESPIVPVGFVYLNLIP